MLIYIFKCRMSYLPAPMITSLTLPTDFIVTSWIVGGNFYMFWSFQFFSNCSFEWKHDTVYLHTINQWYMLCTNWITGDPKPGRAENTAYCYCGEIVINALWSNPYYRAKAMEIVVIIQILMICQIKCLNLGEMTTGSLSSSIVLLLRGGS